MDYSSLYVSRIRNLCRQRGISINKLAVMSDVKQSTLDNIVRGLTKNPRVMTLHKLALAFNMTLAEFLDFPELNDYSFDDARGGYGGLRRIRTAPQILDAKLIYRR